jgi:AraC-like DNA-binding protein
MKTKWLGEIYRNRFYLGLGVIILLNTAGLVAFIWIGQAWCALAGLASSLVVALILAWVIRNKFSKPYESIDQAINTLKNDCASLSSALGELVHGKFDTQLTISSKLIEPPSEVESGDLVEAFNSTINHINTAADNFNTVTSEPLQRLCYVGADSYLEGRICGELMGQALSGRGEVIITLGFFGLTSLELRRQGFVSILHERYPTIRVVEVIATTFDLDTGQSRILSALERHPNLSGIYVTDGAIPTSAAQAVIKAGAEEQVRIIGHDIVEETVHYLKKGPLTCTLTQDLFAQGHDSLVYLYNFLVTGLHPPRSRMLTHLRVVTRENCDQFWKPGHGPLELESNDRLAKPIRRSLRPLHIAVQNREAMDLDQHLLMGTMAASAKLRSFNAHVEVVFGGTLTVKPILEAVLDHGFDALTVIVANPADVPALNQVVENGVAVATYNVEPLSLKTWVSSLVDCAQELMGINEGLHSQLLQSNMQPDVSKVMGAGGRRELERHELVLRAISYMQDNLEMDINLADVSRHVALEQSSFSRVFTEQTGRNPGDFLTELRLNKAKEYLAHSEMSVMDVCVLLGYSPSYFSRLFKNRVGCTPGKYSEQTRFLTR